MEVASEDGWPQWLLKEAMEIPWGALFILNWLRLERRISYVHLHDKLAALSVVNLEAILVIPYRLWLVQ
jgi:hypothetical protein